MVNFDRFFCEFGTDRKRSKKTLITRTYQKGESRGRCSVYTRICTIFGTNFFGVGAQNDDFGVPSKNQEFPKSFKTLKLQYQGYIVFKYEGQRMPELGERSNLRVKFFVDTHGSNIISSNKNEKNSRRQEIDW